MRVRKAVFPAAGWGTRFLPATKAQPKEMLPLVDKPIIQYAVEEAVAAGIEQVIIVTSSQKRAIEDHFDLSYELEHLLEEKGDIEMLRQVRHISDLAQVAYVRQKEQLGLGHAVLMAKDLIGHEPFAVILPDDVVVGDRPVHRPADPRLPPDPRLGRGRRHGGPATRRPAATASSATEPADDPLDHGRLHRVTALVEKPDPATRRPNLAIIGRYVLTPKIFDKLEQTQRGAGGEIQLTDAIEALMEEQEVYGYEFEGMRYDAGTTMGWLKASVELALAAPRPRHRVPSATWRASSSDGRGSRARRGTHAGRTRRPMAARPARERGAARGGDRDDPGRPLSADRAARSGRHGDHLPGPGHAARPRRRGQAAPSRVPARPRLLVALPPGGPGRRVAQPPERRDGLRLRRGPGRPVHRHGARRRRGPRLDPAPERRRSRRARRRASRRRSPAPSRPRTRAASSIATSSPATSSSAATAGSRSPTSGSPGPSPRPR